MRKGTITPTMMWVQPQEHLCAKGWDGVGCGLWDVPAEAHGSTKEHRQAQRSTQRHGDVCLHLTLRQGGVTSQIPMGEESARR